MKYFEGDKMIGKELENTVQLEKISKRTVKSKCCCDCVYYRFQHFYSINKSNTICMREKYTFSSKFFRSKKCVRYISRTVQQTVDVTIVYVRLYFNLYKLNFN